VRILQRRHSTSLAGQVLRVLAGERKAEKKLIWDQLLQA
jgi:hypothetical protein